MGNSKFGSMVPLPYPLVLHSFHSLLPHPSFLPPGSTFLHWVHIGLACPFPLPTPWVMAWNEARRLMQLKRKIKAYMATFNMEMHHKMQKMVRTNIFSTWAKANT